MANGHPFYRCGIGLTDFLPIGLAPAFLIRRFAPPCPFAVPCGRLAAEAAALPTDRCTRLCSASSATGSAEQRGPPGEGFRVRGAKKGRVKALPYGMKFLIYHSPVCRWGGVKKVLDFPTGGDSIAADTVCRSHHTAARCGDTLDGKCTVLPYSVVTASGAVVFSVRE